MGKVRLSKTIGVVLGIVMVLAALGYGLIYLLGRSLGTALGSTLDTTAQDKFTLLILLGICMVGVITGAGSFGLKSKGWRTVYIGFCLIVGMALLVTFFISLGALGTMLEFVILFMGLIYFLLGYFVKKEK